MQTRWMCVCVPREIGSLMQAVSYLALCYGFWSVISGWRITHWISQVGRMALSNYLLQTLICTTFFNVFGFFMHFDRLQLVALVPLVWAWGSGCGYGGRHSQDQR